MARLSLCFLGPLSATLYGEPVSAFEADKVRALLVYLAVESDRPHRRQELAGLLWPDWPERSARTNLRNALSNLRKAIGDRQADPPFLLISRESLQFNSASDSVVDVTAYRELMATGHDDKNRHQRLEQALDLYRGPFLAGFSLKDSASFEDWSLMVREALQREALSALDGLAEYYDGRGEYERACEYATRHVEMAPWREEAHRQLMRLLNLMGRRGAALAQYEACRRVLARELNVEPGAETRDLYERIRADREAVPPALVPTPAPPPALPAYLDEAAEPADVTRPVFVARERELAQLQAHLDEALDGRGGVAFVTGGPGRGKTALMGEFARRAMERHPDLLVATGKANAFSGVGDPYLTFRDVLGILTGDVEGRWAAGAITREHAQRLWSALPVVAEGLADHGAPLIDVILPGPALLARLAAFDREGAGWLARLRTLIERGSKEPADMAQSQLFEAYAGVLQAVAVQRPLLLILDDLQWADSASINLLFHLGRGLAGCRVLILGAYRPEEVALGRAGQRHPLEKVLAEFKRQFGDVWVDLTQADVTADQRFVEVFLDSEPNRLGEGFRNALFQRTGGHPLFTVELLRAMGESGDLVRDAGADGAWVEGAELDWGRLPARVEAVIEERIGRLAEELRDILTLASIEGEDFTAQVVARVGELGERRLLRALSQQLDKRHGLVREQGDLLVGRQLLSRYRFTHTLFQQYLYDDLSAGERRLLHREIAGILEELYAAAGRTEEITVQLAHHYAEAGQGEKAVEYALRAGDQARVAYADQEAIGHYRRALAFLQDNIQSSSNESGDYERVARILMKLGLTYHNAFQFQESRQAFDEAFALHKQAAAMTPAAPPPPAPHALRLKWKEPATLDPTLCSDLFSGYLIYHLFSGLVELSPELDVVPDVAQSWEVSEGGRRFVFHLREDVRWSDGTRLTAEDFEFAWKRVLNPVTGSHSAHMLRDIKGVTAFQPDAGCERDLVGVRALDAATLEVELAEPTGYFLHLLAHNAAFPVPRHVVQRHGEAWSELGNIVTNGPFELRGWRRGESMHFSRYPAYHGQFLGNVQQVELSLWPWDGQFAALGLYEADGLDVALRLDPAESRPARQRHSEQYMSIPILSTTYVQFDVTRPPFDDPRVRQAFVLAVDREQMVDANLVGHVFPATGGLVPPGMPGHSPGIGLPHDPMGAKQLLTEAGYPGGRGFPTLDALTIIQTIKKMTSKQLQTQWRDNLGVEVEWSAVEAGALGDSLSREPPHMHLWGWAAEYPDPDCFLSLALRWSPFHWRNDAYDRLIEEARHTTAPGERIKMYQQAAAILVEEAPIMPVFYERVPMLVKPWVSRFPTSSISPDGSWKDVIIEPH